MSPNRITKSIEQLETDLYVYTYRDDDICKWKMKKKFKEKQRENVALRRNRGIRRFFSHSLLSLFTSGTVLVKTVVKQTK